MLSGKALAADSCFTFAFGSEVKNIQFGFYSFFFLYGF
jgi:hypothetical protein